MKVKKATGQETREILVKVKKWIPRKGSEILR